MTLTQVLSEAGVHAIAQEGDASIVTVQSDSRQCRPGSLFVCMPGLNLDSHQFLGSAKRAGATSALAYSRDGYERALELGLAVAQISDMKDASWRVAEVVNHSPSHRLRVIGITGTNGKTTVASVVRDMLAALDDRPAYIGTLGVQFGDWHLDLPNTTPLSVELSNWLRRLGDEGARSVVMEVSSHALADQRVEGVSFDVGVFTNLSQDHLDFHGTMEAYGAAKYRLFNELGPRSNKPFVSVINVGDPVGAGWAEALASKGETVLRFTTGKCLDPSVVAGEANEIRLGSFDLTLRYLGEAIEVTVPLGGTYNVENSVAASATLLGLGYSLHQVGSSLSKVRPVPGRFEPVANEEGIGVIVDYAHTPDALQKLLEAIRPMVSGRVITVFGCGGDRDSTKRPKMGRISAEQSDLTIVTSDNPRTEPPDLILNEIMAGLPAGTPSRKIIDRPEAIRAAIGMAVPGDAVVIAGKGHENYQIIGQTKFPMDDRELARAALTARGSQ